MGRRNRKRAPQLNFNKVLAFGRESATTSTEICKRYGLERRELERQIQAARLKGYPIAAANSDPMGYYRPETTEEMAEYIRALDSRIAELQAVRDASATSLLDDLNKGL